MYKNIGKTLMGLAIVIGWLGLIGGLIAALAFASNDNGTAAWISLAGGIGDFVFSLFLYAFGQLVDDTRALREHTVPDAARDAPAEPAVSQQSGGEQAERAAFHADVTKEPERQTDNDSEANDAAGNEEKHFETTFLVIAGIVVLLFLICTIIGISLH